MKTFVLRAAVVVVRAAAAIIGLFVRRRDGIALISCQGDEPSQDILDLAAEIGRTLGIRESLGIQGASGRHGVEVAKEAQGASGRLERPGERGRLGTQGGAGGAQLVVIAGLMERSAGGAFRFAGKLLLMLRRIAAARVVVVDAYCPAVSIPKKRQGQKVVQIWHAPEAIKKFSLQILDTPAGYAGDTAEILCMHRGYDYILCPADATRPFFEEAFGYPGDVFVKYGLPSLDRIGLMKRPAPGEEESPERAAARARIYRRYPELEGYGWGGGKAGSSHGMEAGPGSGEAGSDGMEGSHGSREAGSDVMEAGPGSGKAGSSHGMEAGCRDESVSAAISGRPLTVVYAPTFRDGAAADADGLAKAFAREALMKEGMRQGLDQHPFEDAIESEVIGGDSPAQHDGAQAAFEDAIGSGVIGEAWQGVTLVIKPHPREATGGKVPDAADGVLAETDGNKFRVFPDAEFPLTDWYSAADIIITDYSGVAVDAAAAGVASYYYIYDIDDYAARRGINIDLRNEAVGKYAFTGAETLVRQVRLDFSGSAPAYDYKALAAFAGKYLEVPLTGNTKKLAMFISGVGDNY